MMHARSSFGRRRLWLWGLLGLLILGLIGSWIALRSSGRPVRSGELPLAGLSAAVEVHWDAWGVPHITGQRPEDVMAGLGWVHANDRFTQMELGRRAAQGRLAELLGEAAYATDVYFRTLRFPAAVDTLWGDASPRSRSLLEAYAGGVNGWLRQRDGDLPPALRVLGIEPEPWRPQDSLSFALLMAQDLSFWRQRPEEERFRWLRHFGVDAVRELLAEPRLHVPPGILAQASETSESPATGAGSTAMSSPGGGPSPGSNNWALGGRHTASGKPLLANDPHLGLFLPSVWYQAMLRAPGYEAAGMTLPGTPGVIIGRGPHLAWAFTNTMLDDHDVFFERLDEDGEKYLRGTSWVPLQVHEETVEVRGETARSLTLYGTDHGPLLEADPERGLPPRSLSWTAHHGGDPVAALYDLAAATTTDDVLAAIGPYTAPAQNLVVAFESGPLLYTVLGRVPNRRGESVSVANVDGPDADGPDAAGDVTASVNAGLNPVAARPGLGRLPSPGWDISYGWDGLRPRDSNPTVVSPQDDLLVTANQDIRPASYPLPLVADFFPHFRAQRIRRLLVDGGPWTRQGVAEVQLDVVSLYAQELIATLATDAPTFTGDGARAYEILRGWDGAMELEGPSALFALFERHLQRRIFDDDVAAGGVAPFADQGLLLSLLRGDMSADWFDDVSTSTVEGRSTVIAGALEDGWREGAERWGDDVGRWSFGWLHTLTLRHRLDAVPLLGKWYRRGPFEVAGSGTSIAAFGAAWQGERQDILYGPSMRWIVDWNEPRHAFAGLPGGQSGHPADAHYDDQIEGFLGGELHVAPWSEAAIRDATVSTLTLTPTESLADSP